MKTNDCAEEVDRKLAENKRRIRLLSDVNTELLGIRSQQSKIKSLQKEVEELEKELQQTQQKVNTAWYEKIKSERVKAEKLDEELKSIRTEIEANADTPGYQQAAKHTEVQHGQHSKHDAPSTRTNYKNMATRLQNEIKTLKQRVNTSKLSVIQEIKKKAALEEEVRELRINMCPRRSVTPSKFMSASIPDLSLHHHHHHHRNH